MVDTKLRTPSFSCLHVCSKIDVKIFDTDVRTADFFILGSVPGLVLITTCSLDDTAVGKWEVSSGARRR